MANPKINIKDTIENTIKVRCIAYRFQEKAPY